MSTPTQTARQPRPSIIRARDLDAEQTIAGALDQVSEVILGKRHQASLALSCLLAGGHLLIEDIPGVGKTTLAQVFARVLGLNFSRIQFTSDLLPADVVGVATLREWVRLEAAAKADGRLLRLDPTSVVVHTAGSTWTASLPSAPDVRGRDLPGPPGSVLSAAWRSA